MADIGYSIRNASEVSAELWGEPDMSILRPARRSPPEFPIDVLGPRWAQWIEDAADAAAAPPDYVALPLLASASALIGHARWAQATPEWREPPHLWLGVVGDSGSSKKARRGLFNARRTARDRTADGKKFPGSA